MQKIITRKHYLNNEVTHRKYFAQFVNKAVKQEVLDYIGKDALLNSKDEHLNDIPLKKWDALAGYSFFNGKLIVKPYDIKPINLDLIKQANETASCATLVCIYKEAAKQIIENNKEV